MPLTKATPNAVKTNIKIGGSELLLTTPSTGSSFPIGVTNLRILPTGTAFGRTIYSVIRDNNYSYTVAYNGSRWTLTIDADGEETTVRQATIGTETDPWNAVWPVGTTLVYAAATQNTNAYIGEFTMRDPSITTSWQGQNTAHGFNALVNLKTNPSWDSAYGNTAIGAYCLEANVNGFRNTAVGAKALQNSISTNSTGLGFDAQVTGPNQVQLGNSATTTFAYGAVQNRSDVRDKTDVRDTELGLEFVKSLRPVDFKWDMREDYRPEPPVAPSENATEEEKAAYEAAKVKWLEDVKLANINSDGSKKRNRFHHGLIAQEVKAVLDAKGIDFGGFQDHKIAGGDDVLSIGYVELIAPMIKAIQELSAEVASLKAQLNP